MSDADWRPFLDGAVPLPEPRKNSVGRPAGYSQALAERIYCLIAEGASLRDICGKDGIPSRRT